MAAHAKLNLSLEVRGRRSDGMHEISSLMQAISLHDLVEVSPAGTTKLILEDGGGGAEGVPGGEDNLVLRAAATLERHAGRPLPARFRLVKRIPPGAGLGGGSSDAAAALRLLARLYGLEGDLKAAAGEIGADVPFFLIGGAAHAAGTGDLLSPAPSVDGWFAIAWPGFSVATADVYRRWDAEPHPEVAGDPNQLQPVAYRVEPRLAAFSARLGAGWRMTGSGSAFFTSLQTRAEAEVAAARVTSALGCWTTVARPAAAWA